MPVTTATSLLSASMLQAPDQAHRMPVAGAKGMSMSGQSCDSTPFCPCRLLNLSPTTGLRLKRSSTLARCAPAPPPGPHQRHLLHARHLLPLHLALLVPACRAHV